MIKLIFLVTFALSTITVVLSFSIDPISPTFLDTAGVAALDKVEFLAGIFSRSPSEGSDDGDNFEEMGVTGKAIVTDGNNENISPTSNEKNYRKDRSVVASAVESLEKDMENLDSFAEQKSQLSGVELGLLTGSILAAGSGPILFQDSMKIVEVLAPAAAAFSAAIGIGAEYTGRIAVADAKEVASAAIIVAAEAEGLLANAERVKAVTPLCVGVGATAATFSLLAPVLVDAFLGPGAVTSSSIIVTEIYLFPPLIAVLSAAVASLALQETKTYAARASEVGNRRFSRAGSVGRTWLSAVEQIGRTSDKTSQRWRNFVISTLPSPIIGALIPGTLSTKAVAISALAAAQTAFCLTRAEETVARATDAVALKARSAALCDTYANQGARSAAILPFTSALAGLCAAATAALVELPLLEALGEMGGVAGTLSQSLTAAALPTLGSLFAAAASVSKARCEVDAEAANQAANLLVMEDKNGDDPVLRPFQGVLELIKLTIKLTWKKLTGSTGPLAKGLKITRRFQSLLSIFKTPRNRSNKHGRTGTRPPVSPG